MDEYALPKDLIAQEPQLTRVELQNRYGMQHEMIPDLVQGKYLTVIPVLTEQALTPQEYFSLLDALKTNHGVITMQTAFAAPVPEEEGYQCNLHMTAHLRLEQLQTPLEEEEPEE